MKSQRGYTLVELLCVLTLLGLVLYVAVPAGSGIGRQRIIDTTAVEMVIEMRKARQKAITTGYPQRLEFRFYNRDYRVRDTGEGSSYTVKLSEGVEYRATNFPSVGGYPSVTFFPNGSPSSGGTVAIIDNNGIIKYIIITPATARIRISDQPALE